MDHDALRETLQETLGGLSTVRLAVLFGSQASGKNRPESDVDLGVTLDPNTSASRGEVLVEMGRAIGRDIDLVDLTAAPPLLRFQIAGTECCCSSGKLGCGWTSRPGR